MEPLVASSPPTSLPLDRVVFTVKIEYRTLYNDAETDLAYWTMEEAYTAAGQYISDTCGSDWDEYKIVTHQDMTMHVKAQGGDGGVFEVSVIGGPYKERFGSLSTISLVKVPPENPAEGLLYHLWRSIDGFEKGCEELTLIGTYGALEEAQQAAPKLLIKEHEDHDSWDAYQESIDANSVPRSTQRNSTISISKSKSEA